MARSDEEKGNPISRAITFFKECWAELKKVHPPTRQETVQVTMLVLFLVFLFGMFLGVADFVVGEVMRRVLI